MKMIASVENVLVKESEVRMNYNYFSNNPGIYQLANGQLNYLYFINTGRVHFTINTQDGEIGPISYPNSLFVKVKNRALNITIQP